MGHIIVVNRGGHRRVIEWVNDNSRQQNWRMNQAREILMSAWKKNLVVTKLVDDHHELTNGSFDPEVEEYKIVDPETDM